MYIYDIPPHYIPHV